MNDAPDNPLHDWVRQTLHEYRPAPDPAGWARLQRTRQWRRWRGVAAGFLGLLLIGAGWWWAETRRPETTDYVPAESGMQPAKAATVRVPPALAGTPAVPVPASSRVPRRLGGTRPVPATPDRVRWTPGLLTARAPRITDWTSTVGQMPLTVPAADERDIQYQLLTGEFGPDSTSYQVLRRNLRRWPDAVVVCDLTSSMAPYTTQLYAWFRQTARNPSIRGLVFFTDCDSLGQETYPGGPPGRFFVTRERDPRRALPTLLAATRNTRANSQDPENDVEALLFAQQAFPEARHLILLADNSSPVKDLELVAGLRKPVHVVLCGPPLDSAVAFPPEYRTLAGQTRGSLHTLEDDLDPAQLHRGTWLRVGERYYRYDPRRQRFRLTRFRHRPRRLLGLWWW